MFLRLFFFFYFFTDTFFCHNNNMFDKKNFEPVKAVLISEDEGNMTEIMLDISSQKNEIVKILKGPATFIGQWPELYVVIMKCRESVFELVHFRELLFIDRP